MPRSLVTGGAGFIGAHLASALADRGDEVVVLDDLSGGEAANVDERARLIEGSIVDHYLVDELFAQEGFELVYHCAAYAAEGLSHFVRRFNYINNVIGSVNLINAAVKHEVDCFVFTSSIAVYGSAPTPISEDGPLEPEDPYGIAKLAVERDLATASRTFGLDHVILRPHNVYGEGQRIDDRYRNVAGIFINQILNEEPLTIFGDGEQTRAFTYIGDVIDAIATAPRTGGARGEAFNLGTDKPHTVNELADAVRRAMSAPDHPISHEPEREEVRHAHADHSKLRSVFGATAATPLADGIARMVEWARQVGPQASAPRAEIEIERALPEAWREHAVEPGG